MKVLFREINVRFLMTLVVAGCVAAWSGCGRRFTNATNSQSKTPTQSAVALSDLSDGQSSADAAKSAQHKNSKLSSVHDPVLVPNGDSMPPEMGGRVMSSCATLQSNRCVSCCEDSYAFGTNKWDQCVAACPRLDVQQVNNEY